MRFEQLKKGGRTVFCEQKEQKCKFCGTFQVKMYYYQQLNSLFCESCIPLVRGETEAEFWLVDKWVIQNADKA